MSITLEKKANTEYFFAQSLNNDKDGRVVHDFSCKQYPTTFKSVFNCILNFAIAIPTLLFHIPIAIILSSAANLLPFPTSIRRRLQRNVKVYVEQIANTVLGLWFKQTFYVSVDSRLTEMIHKLSLKNEFPKILSIGNHISEIDWLFMSILAETLNFFRYTYIIMKNEISFFPIIGFFTKSFEHAFVMRERSKDPKKRSNDVVSINTFGNSLRGEFDEDKKPHSSFVKWVIDKISIILVKLKIIAPNKCANGLYFPEATNFSEETYKSTLAFYDKAIQNPSECEGIFKPEYVLLPRPLGTSALLANLSSDLDCICDTTLLSLPFVSSTSECISFADIFLCKAPAFSFCMILDYLEIPQDIKDSINELPNPSASFELPLALTPQEKVVKNKVTGFLFDIFKKKDNLIKNYVQGEYKGNFEDITEFEQFSKKHCKTALNSPRQCLPIKMDSQYKTIIFFAPVFFFLFIFYFYFVKTPLTIPREVLQSQMITNSF